MSKNDLLRQHLAKTCGERRSKNCFRFGAIEIKLGPNSPVSGVEYVEQVKISIYDPSTDVDVVLYCSVDVASVIENALSD